MKVEIWSDIACPFCYIGKRKFETALKQFEHRDHVQKEFKSFQLDPNAKKKTTNDIHEILASKYGVTYERAKQMNVQVTEQAKQVGLVYNMDSLIPTNTLDAHRLSHYAKQKGQMEEMMERIFKAYFTESLNISDYNTLVNIAEEEGFDKSEVLEVLSEGKYRDEVIKDMQEANKIGVQGVPFFVFNRKYAVSGAQNPEAFLDVLNKVWEEENANEKIKVLNRENRSKSSEYCDDGSCSIE